MAAARTTAPSHRTTAWFHQTQLIPIPFAPALLIAALISLSLSSGCGDEKALCPPGSGAIVGSVFAGGRPLMARVTAQSDDLGGGATVIAWTDTDPTGIYRLHLPTGRYSVRLSAEGGGFYIGRDGLVLDPSSARIFAIEEGATIRSDIACASLVVRLALGFGYSEARFNAWLWDGSDYVRAPGVYVDPRGPETIDFRFTPVVAGRYKIQIDVSDSSQSAAILWFPGTYRRSEGAWIDIVEGRESFVQGVLDTPGSLRGTLTGASRELGIESFLSLESDSVLIGIASSHDGAFTFPILAPVRARLRISSRHGLTRWYGGWTFGEATPLDLGPGSTIQIEIRDSGIDGRLDRMSDWGTDVAVCTASGKVLGDTPVSHADGTFRIANLPPGTYTLHVGPGPTWVPQWFDGADTVSAATPIVISREGEIVHVDVHLVDGGGIQGRVRDAGGAGIADAFVFAQPIYSDYGTHGEHTDEEGTYHVPYVPDGDYRVFVEIPGLPVVWYPGVLDPDSAAVVSVRHFVTVEGIDIRVPR